MCTPSLLLRKNSLEGFGKTKETAAGSSAPPVDEGPAAAAAAGQLGEDAGEKMKVLRLLFVTFAIATDVA